MGIVKKLKISAQSIVIHPLWKQSDGLPIFPLHIHSLLSIPILCPIASDLLIKTKLSLITFLWWIIRRAALLYCGNSTKGRRGRQNYFALIKTLLKATQSQKTFFSGEVFDVKDFFSLLTESDEREQSNEKEKRQQTWAAS